MIYSEIMPPLSRVDGREINGSALPIVNGYDAR